MHTQTHHTAAGQVAYTDVGEGPALVFLHGNPTSARLYRHLIRGLKGSYRCSALDYLGFGRSDAPETFSYRPPAHAALVEGLLCRLDLTDLTLVLHDWGGPIGLSYALRHPDRVRRLVLLNTWAWPLTHRPLVRTVGRLIDSSLGRQAVVRGNAFARLVMPATVGRRDSLVPSWIRPYADALDTRTRRRACWTFARSLTAETDWLRALWTRRSRLHDTPTLLCWGMADPAFGTEETLARWQALVSEATVQRYSDVGHYVPEELGPSLVPPVESFLQSTAP